MSESFGFSAHKHLASPASLASDIGAVCLGDPSIPGPSPVDWVWVHHKTTSLTLFAPTLNGTMFKYDLTVVKTLRELHVKHPDYLGLRLGATSSRHWLHDVAVSNQLLETLTLYGPEVPGLSQTQIVPFKISNYFGHSSVLPSLAIQSLTLRHFILSDTELNNLLTFCPKLTRLELEHVSLVSESHMLLPHNGLAEIVLVKTTPTLRLIQVLAGVRTVVLKGAVDPVTSSSRGTHWRISRPLFDRLILGMPLLETVKIDRVDFLVEDVQRHTGTNHPQVKNVFKTADMKLVGYFPNAGAQPYKN
ncbi:hypothetical protein CPC16_002961 [Podila verticillata]|nr:hypothetical protein BGZ52_005516 [Haplosporangium bisporale]KAF9371628.1 hypothetical protein CPC16_002961 [Podila verticillata]